MSGDKEHHWTLVHMFPLRERNKRQKRVIEWVRLCFGVENASPKQRALRFLEEAIELYQSVEGDKEQLHKLVDYVFSRPVGTIESELGGVGTTLLALADSLSLSADECEVNELRRVLRESPEHFAQRNKEKDDAGFKAED